MPTSNVSISNDVSVALPLAVWHDYMGPIPPAPIAPMKAPASQAIDFPATILWPPGMAVGKNKLTSSVFHKGNRIALDAHDCGIMIAHYHLAPSPSNYLLLLIIPFSSRKTMFSASTVNMNKSGTACVALLAPMMVCWQPISLPLGWVPTNNFNTCKVGMTAGDMLAGWAGIAFSIVVDVILWGCSKGFGKEGLKGLGDGVKGALKGALNQEVKELSEAAAKKAFTEALLGKLLGGKNATEILIKWGGSLAAGTIRLLATRQGSGGNITVGSPYLEIKAGSSVDSNKKGSTTVSAGTVGTGAEIGSETTPGKPGGKIKAEVKDRDYDGVTSIAKKEW